MSEQDYDPIADDDPLGPPPVEPDFDLPPLDPGAVGVMIDWIFPPKEDLQSDSNDYEDHLREQSINVHVDPVFNGTVDDPNAQPPVVRISGYHEQVRAALVEYTGGDHAAAEEIYHAAVTAVGTGSVIGGVEARFDAYNGMTSEYRSNPETTTQTAAARPQEPQAPAEE